jgi:hypothetical protein
MHLFLPASALCSTARRVDGPAQSTCSACAGVHVQSCCTAPGAVFVRPAPTGTGVYTVLVTWRARCMLYNMAVCAAVALAVLQGRHPCFKFFEDGHGHGTQKEYK